ncbi:MAG: DNA polymerase (family 10), partial [Saprospiraceae bacterium]
MTNRELASIFNKLGKIMELHGENPFKVRSYSSAYNTIRRFGEPLIELDRDQLLAIKGIGQNIADKVEELKETGQLSALQKYIDLTPGGIAQMLEIKGLGAKKILMIWREMGIESPGELLYACEENRLIELKGFGVKTQQSLKEQLIYFLDGQGKYLYGHVESEGMELLDLIRTTFPEENTDVIGTFGRKMPIVDAIELLTEVEIEEINEYLLELEAIEEREGELFYKGTLVLISTPFKGYETDRWSQLASDEFLEEWNKKYPKASINEDEATIFESQNLQFIPAESRESALILEQASNNSFQLIDFEDIKGVVHNHSTYSDGVNSIKEMADACIELGYEYLVMSDHSQSAFYADGLKPDRVYQQMEEIDTLNESYQDFHIYKSIESDILSDGRLDYDEELLSKFDIVIASVHSNLKMDEEKAHMRLLNAIANPATRILGHPTGRLLLSRPGYPIDHKLIIDACAEYNVAIELNASPYRLDVDWTWVPYAMERDVLVAINPDAHSIAGIKDIRFGVIAARKGGLPPDLCLNTKSRVLFDQWIG